MAFKVYNHDTILHAIPQTINFMNFAMCRVGMKLAMLDGLSDLKGLVDPQTFTGPEFDLLDTQENETIKIMMESIDKMHKAIDLWFLLNGLCDLDLLDHEEGREFAQLMYGMCVIGEGKVYEDIILDIGFVYGDTMMIFYLLGLLYSNGGIDLEEDIDFGEMSFDFYCSELSSLELLDQTERNVKLLYDLIVDLNRDYVRMLRLNGH